MVSRVLWVVAALAWVAVLVFLTMWLGDALALT